MAPARMVFTMIAKSHAKRANEVGDNVWWFLVRVCANFAESSKDLDEQKEPILWVLGLISPSASPDTTAAAEESGSPQIWFKLVGWLAESFDSVRAEYFVVSILNGPSAVSVDEL